MGRSVKNIDIGFGIQMITNLLSLTLIAIKISYKLDPNKIAIFQGTVQQLTAMLVYFT